LRAGEVVALTLDDLDWERGEILVRGKGQRLGRLPLPTDVGALALVRFDDIVKDLQRRFAPFRQLVEVVSAVLLCGYRQNPRLASKDDRDRNRNGGKG
jgi:integrase